MGSDEVKFVCPECQGEIFAGYSGETLYKAICCSCDFTGPDNNDRLASIIEYQQDVKD